MTPVSKHLIKTITRCLFALLLLYEFANYFGVLRGTLTYTWRGLAMTNAFMLLLIETVALWLRKHTIELHWSAWPMVFLITAIDAFGDIFGWYVRIGGYDKFAHFAGGFLGSLCILGVVSLLSSHHGWRHHRLVSVLFTFGLITSLGVFYEIEEYLEDFFTGSHRLGDGFDTANDLLMDVTSAAIGLLVAYVWQHYQELVARRKKVKNSILHSYPLSQ